MKKKKNNLKFSIIVSLIPSILIMLIYTIIFLSVKGISNLSALITVFIFGSIYFTITFLSTLVLQKIFSKSKLWGWLSTILGFPLFWSIILIAIVWIGYTMSTSSTRTDGLLAVPLGFLFIILPLTIYLIIVMFIKLKIKR